MYDGPVEIEYPELCELYGKLHAACDLLEEVATSCNREHFEKIMDFLKEIE